MKNNEKVFAVRSDFKVQGSTCLQRDAYATLSWSHKELLMLHDRLGDRPGVESSSFLKLEETLRALRTIIVQTNTRHRPPLCRLGTQPIALPTLFTNQRSCTKINILDEQVDLCLAYKNVRPSVNTLVERVSCISPQFQTPQGYNDQRRKLDPQQSENVTDVTSTTFPAATWRNTWG